MPMVMSTMERVSWKKIGNVKSYVYFALKRALAPVAVHVIEAANTILYKL